MKTDFKAIIREQVKLSGKTVNRIAREAGIDRDALYRFTNLASHPLTTESMASATMAKLFDYFGLKVTK